VLLAGCNGQRDLLNDPLRGSHLPAQAAPGPVSAAPAAADVPALPSTHAMTSPAALVGGPTPAAPSMRIGEAPGPAAPVPQAGGTSAALRGPEPSAADAHPSGTPGWPTSTYQLASASGTSPPAPAAENMDNMLDELEKRGAEYQSWQKVGANDFRFRCMVPNQDNRMLGRNYEGRGQTRCAAIKAVIEQIDHDRGGR
jgi:hypothetical protein